MGGISVKPQPVPAAIPGPKLAALQRRVVREIVASSAGVRATGDPDRERLVARVVLQQIKLLQDRDRRRQALRERILSVVEDGSLRAVFQPIVDVESGMPVGVEALARFRCEPVRSPDQWFAEARTVGLGRELEMAALRAAVTQMRRLPRGMFIAVNVSPQLLTSSALWTLLAEVDPARLVLEITEHSRIRHYSRIQDVADGLRGMGVRLAVDDVGAGFASLRHVLVLRPDLIKLDVSITRDVDTDPARQLLIASILAFAAEMSTTVVAEGVETVDEMASLRDLGIRYAQGFGFGRPASLAGASRPGRLALTSTRT
jgi:EAL domain-containing protein (putative c-di-GMP-specific phosphodiesterase class I)